MSKLRLLKNSVAFTLLEIMVVIVVISIVASFAIPSYTRSILKQRERDAIVQLTAIHAAAQFYLAQAGDYWTATDADRDAINANLNMKIVSPDLAFDYDSTAGTGAFQVTATWLDSMPAKDFTVLMDQNPIDPLASPPNPCCSAGACPSLDSC